MKHRSGVQLDEIARIERRIKKCIRRGDAGEEHKRRLRLEARLKEICAMNYIGVEEVEMSREEGVDVLLTRLCIELLEHVVLGVVQVGDEERLEADLRPRFGYQDVGMLTLDVPLPLARLKEIQEKEGVTS